MVGVIFGVGGRYGVTTDGVEVGGVYRCYKRRFCTLGASAHFYSGSYGSETCGVEREIGAIGGTRSRGLAMSRRHAFDMVGRGRCLSVGRIKVLLNVASETMCGCVCDKRLGTVGLDAELAVVRGSSVSSVVDSAPCMGQGEVFRAPVASFCAATRITDGCKMGRS